MLVALAIGVFCRKFEIPLPAPNAFLGVLLIFCIYLGYRLMDLFLKA
jgi:XapX domain-containing protein